MNIRRDDLDPFRGIIMAMILGGIFWIIFYFVCK